ncbi:MAG: branched-chain amino acid ABC transporter permease [Chloroflexota bacterium]|nr:branched-chain amino acid ABC transporter permease [Chloroflexota bacterium]
MYPGVVNTRYDQDIAITRTPLQFILWALGAILVFAVMPLTLSGYWLNFFTFILIAVVATLGLHILTGLCGLISLGHAAFMAVGAYVCGILASTYELPFWVTIPCAGIGAGLVGLFFGAPSLRIKGLYLAMSTFAAQFIIIWIIKHTDTITGGNEGLFLPYVQLGSRELDSALESYVFTAVVTIIMTFLAMNIARTRIGRAFIAIRDNDHAAEVMGVNVFGYKLLAFFIGCSFAGVAGALWAYLLVYLQPLHFGLEQSIWFLGMIIVGGLGSTLGAILGAGFIEALDMGSDLLAGEIGDVFPSLAGMISSASGFIVFALVIIIFLVFEPRGLAHRWQLIKNSYRLWPYSY